MWLREMFGVEKPIIAMCHMPALPGDPEYDFDSGISEIVERCRRDLAGLQEGGVDGVMFSNEGSIPYLTTVEPITTVSMARIIGELRNEIQIPFGVNVLWDPKASIELAVATGALFVREVFTGAYGSDFGIWDTNVGQYARQLSRLGGGDVRLLFNIVPESAEYLSPRDLADIARSTVFNARPDAICVSGLTAGVQASVTALKQVKEAIGDVPLIANTGVTIDNLSKQLSIADAAVVGTTFKHKGNIWNPVDGARVKSFMARAHEFRAAHSREDIVGQ